MIFKRFSNDTPRLSPGVTPTRSARTCLMDVPAYGSLVGLGDIVFGRVIGWFLGAARDFGKSDWGGKGKRY